MAATSNALGFPLLTVVLFLPLAAAIVCSLINDGRAIKLIGVAAAVIDFLLAVFLLVRFEMTPAGPTAWQFQFADRTDWIASMGITYWLGVDGVAVFLIGLTTLLFAVALYSADFMIVDRVKAFVVLMLLLETAVLGVFMAINLFLFFVFWEAMLIPTYFLMAIWGEERRIYATMKFVVYTIFGSFFMLVAIFYLWASAGTLDMVGPHGLIAHPVLGIASDWLFLGFAIAFAIKLPLFPFHTWAPTAYSESPVPVVVPLAGVLSKAGAFGFIRYCLPLFPGAAQDFQGLIAVLAIIGILYAAGLALVQKDIKRIVAYSSISHMNLIVLGIFSFNATGMDGSVLQMVNHGVIIVGLFLAVAYLAARTGTRSITEMGGLGSRWPLLMWTFFVFVLAALDLPGLSSFAGEFLILAGVFKANAWWASIAALAVILAAWYMITFFQNTMNGPPTASPEQVAETVEDPHRTAYEFPVVRRLISRDLLPRELLLFVPLMALILYIGVQPSVFTDRMNATTNAVTSILNAQTQPTLGGGR